MSFSDPRWLWALLALPVLALLEWRAAHRARARLARLAGARESSVLLMQRLPGQRRLGLVLRLGALAALAVGAAGPEWGTELTRRVSSGSDVVLVMDVSASMDARDVAPSRLEEARREALAVLDRLQGSKVGVVAFAGDAIRMCPLTLDRGAARLVIESLTTGSVSEPGTDIGRALRTAAQMLPEGRRSEQAIVLWTDGEDLEGGARAALDEVTSKGLRVYAVGVGTPAGDVVPVLDDEGRAVDIKRDSDGGPVHSRLDEDLLRELARRSRGGYFAASQAGGETARLVATLSQLARGSRGERLVERAVPRFPWFAGAAALLLALDRVRRHRRGEGRGSGREAAGAARAAALVALLAAALAPRAGMAQSAWARGDRAFRDGQWRAADSLYTLRSLHRASGSLGVDLGTARARRQDRRRAGHARQARGRSRRGRDHGRVQPRHPARREGRLRRRAAGAPAVARARPRGRGRALELRVGAAQEARAAATSVEPAPAAAEATAPATPAALTRDSPAVAAVATPAVAATAPALETATGAPDGTAPGPATGRAHPRESPAAGTAGAAAHPSGAGDAREAGEGLVRRPVTWTLAACLALGGWLAPAVVAGAQVDAHLDRDHAVVGESVLLVVSIEGSRQVEEPHFDLPTGLDLQGSDRAQNFSWVNGRTTSQLQFRYQIGATRVGTFPIGPISVKVDGQELRSGSVTLVVSPATVTHPGAPAAPPARAGGGRPPASLSVVVEPRDPYVGQPVMLRARLIQRAPFAEDPQYAPPATTGFWVDQPGAPESYYSDEPGGRVLVTETRTRMFPLASGDATIGAASAHVVFAAADPMDPLGWINGGRREYVLSSEAVPVHVRALPAGAPAGYGGAVGGFEVSWEADRDHTARDVPLTLRLSVRGRGNLPLIQVPAFASNDLEVFAQTVDDSLGAPGSAGPGRKRFQWTVLSRREGPLEVPSPEFCWFDPADGRYHVVAPPSLRIEVDPPVYPGGAASPGGYPAELVEVPVRAGTRPIEPWGWGLGGALAAFGVGAWRSAGRRVPETPERARALEWLRAVGITEGPDFWRAAEESVEWLAARGVQVTGLGAEVRRARYGGHGADPAAVRARLVERLSATMPRSADRFTPRILAVVAVLTGGFVVALLGWGPAMPGSAASLREAESAARRGRISEARDTWTEAWQLGLRTPPLAARLVWAELQLGDVGHATAWALRGRRAEPRDPALEWMAARAREAGGLLGAPLERWPVRRWEWATASLALALVAGFLWPRRVAVVVIGAMAMAAGVIPELEAWAMHARPLAVVIRSCTLGDGGLELQPGQVVRVTALRADGTEVRAGEEKGRVPSDALEPLERPTGGPR
ncbi:MAG: VWA domain-containing protein [Candidatus Eisenbacteria bacterium]